MPRAIPSNSRRAIGQLVSLHSDYDFFDLGLAEGSGLRMIVAEAATRSQFFKMMQSPPADFNPLHNFAAFSADAKGPTRAR